VLLTLPSPTTASPGTPRPPGGRLTTALAAFAAAAEQRFRSDKVRFLWRHAPC
jgi:hypothetical protein